MVEKKIIKNRKAIFVISAIFLLALILLPSVHSQQCIAYFKLWANTADSCNTPKDNSATANGAVLKTDSYPVFNISGQGTGSYYFDGNADYLAMRNYSNFRNLNKWTICAWYKTNGTLTTETQERLIYFTDKVYLKYKGSTGGWGNTIYDTDFRNYAYVRPPSYIPINAFSHICFWRNSTNGYKIYINGTEKSSQVGTAPVWPGTWTFAYISSDSTNAFQGWLSTIWIYNASLNASQIRNLYNFNNVSWQPPPPPANFTLYAYDVYDSSKINIFNVTIKNGSKTWNFTTTTGTLNAYPFRTNHNTKINITYKVSNYLNRALFNYNISLSGNKNQSMIQAVMNLQTKMKVINTIVPGVTYRINYGSTIYTSPIYIKAGKYNITFIKANWYNKTQEFSIGVKENTTKNITGAYDTKLNITARIGNSAGTITGATYNVSWVALDYSEQTTSSGTSSQFNVLSSSSSTGIYRIEARKPNFYVANNKTYTATLGFKTTNISLYQWNTFNMTTVDEETLLLVKNTTATIYGITSTYNKTVTMEYGKGNLSLLVPDLYSFIYKDKFGRYTERFRYITMVNGTYNNIALYLLNASKGTAITVTLLDQVGNQLDNYIVVAEKFIPASYQYIPVQSEMTSVNGLSQFNILTGNTQYRWKVVKNNVVLYTENLSKIFSTTKTIKLTVGSTFNSGQEALSTWQLATTLKNKSNVMNLSWITLQGTSGTICMNVSWQNTSSSTRININSQCSSATAGSLTYNYSAYTTGTITAISWIKGSINILDIYNVVLGTGIKLWNIIGNDGWLVYMILMIVGACFMITNITAMPMVLAVIHFACWGMGLIPINIGITGLAVIVVLILISLRLEK